MTFIRTAAGLSAIHLFHGVDLVICCEGGAPTALNASATSETSGLHSPVTLDVIFWKNVLKLLKINKKFHVISCGSKTNILSILKICEQESISTLVMAVDSDYDWFLEKRGRRGSDSKILKTYGYSWESDLMHEKTFLEIVEHLVGPCDKNFEGAIKRDIGSVQRKLHRWSHEDLRLILKTQLGLIDKSKPQRYVVLPQKNSSASIKIKPSLNEVYLRLCLKSRTQDIAARRRTHFKLEHSFRFSFGKLTSRLIFHLLMWHARQITNVTSFPYEEFMKLAMTFTFALAKQGALKEFKDHYEAQALIFS